MRPQPIAVSIVAMCLLLGGPLTPAAVADAKPDGTTAAMPASPKPIPVSPTLHSNESFTELPPWPKSMVRSGNKRHASRTLFVGEMTIELYEGSDEVINLVDQPYDELVHVVRGECTLTPKGGVPQRFKAGDIFIVPKGFTGTWDARNQFRELISIESSAYNKALQLYFPAEK